jgi:hypothetical protein
VVDVESQVVVENFTSDRSPRKRMKDFATEEFVVYVDTNTLGLGNHTGEATVFFGKVGLGEGSFEQKSFPITIQVSEPIVIMEEQPLFTINLTVVFIILAVILLLVINALLLRGFVQKKDREEARKQYHERWDELDEKEQH